MMIYDLVGGFNPSEKYESQWGVLFPIYGKNVPNHQPVIYLAYRSCNNIHNCGHNCTDFVKYQSPKTVAETPSFKDDVYDL